MLYFVIPAIQLLYGFQVTIVLCFLVVWVPTIFNIRGIVNLNYFSLGYPLNKSENVTIRKRKELFVSLLQSQFVLYRQVQSAHTASGGPNKSEQLPTKEKLLPMDWLQWNGPGS